MTTPYDYDDDVRADTTQDEAITWAARDWQRVVGVIGELEGNLREAKARLQDLEERVLPDLMDAAGVQKLTLTDGTKLEVDTLISASVPKKNLAAVVQWLDQHGHGGMVEREISIPMGRGGAIPNALHNQLVQLGLTWEDTSTVNTTRLKSWAREMLERGQAFPSELFGMYIRRAAKLTMSKGARP